MIVDVAAKLRISRQQVHRLISRGLLPQGLKLGRSRRWLASELENWMREQSQPKARKAR
jgi:predicted DNA-binding transcriptional regulator AlpA